ncbi:Aquaporin-1 [Hyphodiscus hymeniophilus]|uniref:Aquaporin-1 n=1 Tax=Hyphodiscus hymeniophilus TaxID=353542 RepID=A0A9P6SKI1_9HELO|nr:Aquaporin-1 [Hyphodiscus hymeniophilus]
MATESPHKEMRQSSSVSYSHEEAPILKREHDTDGHDVSRHDYHEPDGSAPSQGQVVNGAGLAPAHSFPALGDKNYDNNQGRLRSRLKKKYSTKHPMLRWTKFMDSPTKNNVVAVIGEFLGTTMFLFFAFAGTQLANVEVGDTSIQIVAGQPDGFNPGTLFYISASFGLSLMVNAWVFFRISGGLFNPAVTLAVALIGAIGPLRAVLLFCAQMTGACFAAYLVEVMFPTPFKVQTTLQYGTTVAQGVWIEALCTAMLVFTIIMLAVEKHRATFMAPIAIGIALFIGELIAVYYTGGSLNPARSFGPAAVQHNFMHNHWVYWVGPFIGAIFAVLAFWMFKALEYEFANPGQDADVENDPTRNPNHQMAHIVEKRHAEVAQIRAIEQEGGFRALNNVGQQGSVLGQQGAIGMAVAGVRDGDEIRVKRIRKGEPDLEANWPATQGVDAAQSEKLAEQRADGDSALAGSSDPVQSPAGPLTSNP